MLKGIVSGVEKDITKIPMQVGGVYKEGWEVRDNQDRLTWGREDELQTATGTLPFKGYGLPLKVKSLLGNTQQTGTPTPDAQIIPEFVGVRTAQLLDKSATNTNNGYIPNGYLTSDGVKQTLNGYRTSEYISVSPNESYILRYGAILNVPSVCFYDSSKNFISGVAYNGRQTVPFTTPQNAAFLRLPSTAAGFAKAMLNSGSTALPYEPYGYKIPISCAGQTTPVYVGEVPTVRRVKKLVLTGEEIILRDRKREGSWRFFTDKLISAKSSTGICSHFENIGIDGVNNSDNIGFSIFNNAQFGCRCPESIADTVTDFKSYLAQQYANGTPVTVWYVLAEPETAIVNEPLCKIGDYADELTSDVATLPEIPTTTGPNTLIIDTVLAPSSLTIKGHAKKTNI